MPQSPWKVPARLALALAAIVLLGACATPYQEKSLGGGYQEREVGPNRWYVEFFGNGYTTRDTVVAYWLYRCAELTAQKGFDYFVMISKRPAPGAALQDADEASLIRAKGGGTSYVPIYVPGGGVTTWSSRGVIELRKGDAESEPRPTFVAREVLEKLGPPVRQAMESGKNVVLPKSIFAREEREPRPASEGVKLEDLDALLPKK